MISRVLVVALLAVTFLVGCAGPKQAQIVYYDLEGINHIPGMIWASLMRPGEVSDRELVKIIGHFGESSIEIASRTVLDTPLIVSWYDSAKVDHTRPFPFKILPPLDTANQKYHIRFTFYPGDSVRIQARAVAKSDCRHTISQGATALGAFGPCVSDRGWGKTLDSVNNHLIPDPGLYKFPGD